MSVNISLTQLLKLESLSFTHSAFAVRCHWQHKWNLVSDCLKGLSDIMIDEIENITEKVNQSPVITVFTDESTDIAVHHKQAINLKWCSTSTACVYHEHGTILQMHYITYQHFSVAIGWPIRFLKWPIEITVNQNGSNDPYTFFSKMNPVITNVHKLNCLQNCFPRFYFTVLTVWCL